MTRFIRFFVPSMLLCSLALAQGTNPQQIARVGFSPVPLWPQNGILSEDLRDQYVFLDPTRNEVVLNVPDGTNDSAARKQIRFNLHGNVDPTISVAIHPVGSGQLLYNYSVKNGESAKQNLQEFRLLVPGDPTTKALSTRWKATQVSTEVSTKLPPPNPDRLIQLQWTAEEANLLASNRQSNGFQVFSMSKPGFVLSVARGQAETEVSKEIKDSLPQPAKEQLDKLLQPQWDGKLTITLGPKFRSGTPSNVIAADFYTGMKMLVKRKLLEPKSPFVSSTLQALDSFIQSGQPNFNTTAINTAAAQPGVEQEIANALQLSLEQ